MSNSKRVLMVVFILVLCIGLDQVTKHIAGSYLSRTKVVSLTGVPLKLHYNENRGGSFTFE